ncbi:helix-turn-helix domain-containing protein [Methylocella tundrae]|uniref:Transcriptional regulator, AraC family n=1 Tax=Methylocella tundrae TaxID=227605 RepID=A0A4U8YZR0_METTU|nr:helix-turn-helix domain-containing protein [Methylocella tundrae]WPP06159.1 helix-turn-helix domain-containing protein [Methylocella tundrae]VFU08785.1 Transcriptional regulator, AraC family [Methylocella tundrae]
MNHSQAPAGDGGPANVVDVEEQLSWSNGSVLMKTQGADSSCQRHFLRKDLAIGILFQNPGSEVNWRLDSKPALAKAWTSTMGSHDLVVLPPGCEFRANCRGSGQGLWLFIDPQSVLDDHRVKSFAERATVDCSWTKDRLAWTVVSEIRKECANGFPRGPMFLENTATMFLTELAYFLEDGGSRFEPIRALDDTKLRMVVEYIETNLHRNITLTELSGLVELTPRYFCGAFKQAMGRPPHQFQIEQRIERAKTLLHEPRLSLIDIALTVGFNSQSHLNDYFRRVVGVTPARYRAEMRPGKTTPPNKPSS